MKPNSSAIASGERPLPRSRRPYAAAAGWGLLGVVAFSVTLPATRAAVPAFGPVVVGLGRAVVAAALAGAALLITRAPRPARSDWPSLAIVAAGVVVGFPLLSALALGIVGSAHAAVFVALLPLATAVAAVVRAGERPSVLFWVLSVLGAALTIGFALVQGAGSLGLADLLMLGAVVAAGFGYADGGILSRRMPSWRVIAWALVVSAPVMAAATAVAMAIDPPMQVTGGALLGMAYVSVVSMFLGFLAWYRGLALGGVARIGQIQLVQPLLTLLWSVLLLGEVVDSTTVIAAAAICVVVAATQRARVR